MLKSSCLPFCFHLASPSGYGRKIRTAVRWHRTATFSGVGGVPVKPLIVSRKYSKPSDPVHRSRVRGAISGRELYWALAFNIHSQNNVILISCGENSFWTSEVRSQTQSSASGAEIRLAREMLQQGTWLPWRDLGRGMVSQCLAAVLSSQPAVNIAAYIVTKCCHLAGDCIFSLKEICCMLNYIWLVFFSCHNVGNTWMNEWINKWTNQSVIRIVAD